MGEKYNFHGDPDRFPVIVNLIYERFVPEVKYVADVAGGQGMLTKLLTKKLNLECEVIDPRGYRIRNVPGQETEFKAEGASYYDLVVGLHPDEATQQIAMSALVTRTILVPCCNFWDRSQRLGTVPLVEAIEKFYREHEVHWERIKLDFRGPKNIALITKPPEKRPNISMIKLPDLTVVLGAGRNRREAWMAEKKRKGLKAPDDGCKNLAPSDAQKPIH